MIDAPRASDNGSNLGTAYLFVRSSGGWLHQPKLLPRDGASEERFGPSVAMSATTAVVGAYGDDDISLDSGSAHIVSLSKTGRNDQELPANHQ